MREAAPVLDPCVLTVKSTLCKEHLPYTPCKAHLPYTPVKHTYPYTVALGVAQGGGAQGDGRAGCGWGGGGGGGGWCGTITPVGPMHAPPPPL